MMMMMKMKKKMEEEKEEKKIKKKKKKKKKLCHFQIITAIHFPFYGGSKTKWDDCRLLPIENAHHGEREQKSLDPNSVRKFINSWRHTVKIE